MADSAARPAASGTRRALVLALFVGSALAVGCGRRNAYVPPPPPLVVVGTAKRQPVTLYHEYTGTTEASKSVQIRARVQGYLESIHFQDGSTVSRGHLLFVIDPRPYEAQLEQARADLASKEAQAVQTEALYRRTLALLPSRSASQEEADIARGNWLVARAGVAQARAAVRSAQLNLDFTRIHAPIAGRLDRRLVDVGNLVVADSTLLTTVARYDPMYAYFTVSEMNYLDYLERLRRRPSDGLPGADPAPTLDAAGFAAGLPAAPDGAWGALAAVLAAEPHYPIELGLANESGYPHQGYIDFAANTVDPGSGTLTLRGVFRNPEPFLLAPGLFVRIRVPVGKRPDALLVPDSALGTDQAGRYLLVVGPDNVVEHRSVRAGALVGGMRVIEEGLRPGERFVVEGLQRARPGSKVRPQESGVRSQDASPKR